MTPGEPEVEVDKTEWLKPLPETDPKLLDYIRSLDRKIAASLGIPLRVMSVTCPPSEPDAWVKASKRVRRLLIDNEKQKESDFE